MSATTSNSGRLTHVGPPQRLDQALAAARPDLSRSRWQDLIKSGRVRVNGEIRKPRDPVRDGNTIEYDIPPPVPAEPVAEDLPLNILYEDDQVLVLNKPPGLVVHPAPGHARGTLVNALLHHCADLAGIGGELRPGIVHRLDRDTSGVMVVAKTDRAMQSLAAQFKGREVRKQYLALAWGRPIPATGVIETLVGRHPHHRKKMSARPRSGRPAVTRYETVSAFETASLLRVRIETGRTHQIRVHLAHLGHPVVGDAQYGRARTVPGYTGPLRQMLHAEQLSFRHPVTGDTLEFQAPLPADMRSVLRALGGQAGE